MGLSQFVENQQATPLKVCKLFYENGQWIHELLATWFDYDVVSRISRIPLSVYATKDTIIWTDSKIGMFTVKPAYYKVRKMLDRVQRTSNEARQVWSCIWKATLAPIVKHFMWRLIVLIACPQLLIWLEEAWMLTPFATCAHKLKKIFSMHFLTAPFARGS